jgi:hypothetical protein
MHGDAELGMHSTPSPGNRLPKKFFLTSPSSNRIRIRNIMIGRPKILTCLVWSPKNSEKDPTTGQSGRINQRQCLEFSSDRSTDKYCWKRLSTRTKMSKRPKRKQKKTLPSIFTNPVRKAQRRASDHGNRALDSEEKRTHDADLTTTELKKRGEEFHKPGALMADTKSAARTLWRNPLASGRLYTPRERNVDANTAI